MESATGWRQMVAEVSNARRRARGRGRAGEIRIRTTAAAVVVVGVFLVIASVGMVAFLQASIRDDVRTTALARVQVVGAALRAGSPLSTTAVGDADEEFVQVVDDAGVVVEATANVAGRPALVNLAPGGETTLDHVPFEEGPFLVVSGSTSTADGPVTVIVGRDLEDVAEATAPVIASLAIGVPLLLALVGAVTWLIVGRALAPVERIRREVEAVSAEELHRRVPDPPGSDEISHLASTMNRMLDRLEASHVRQRRFVSDASHELRSPVASIRQHAEVAIAHPERSDVRELAEPVLAEAERLQRLVEDLLLLSRIDEGARLGAAEPIDVDDLVLEEAARLREATSLRIDTRGVSAGRVLGDRARLAHLLRNLTDNAARHARSAIRLSLSANDGWVVLSVEDDGSGVASEDRGRIFDRFVRLETARDRDSGGAGLGLSIVREVARLHGGSVSVTDGANGGARFEVRLPSAEA